jgi:hypothetical protein
MRAGLKLIPIKRHIHRHADKLRRPPVTSILMGFMCLAGVLWLSLAPLFFAGRCGLLPLHDHLLLGGAGESDLAAHLAAEAACAGGGVSQSPDHIHIDAGTIISISRFEPRSSTSVLAMFPLVLTIPVLPGSSGLLLLFVWSLPSPRMGGSLYALSPGVPPPKAGLPAG